MTLAPWKFTVHVLLKPGLENFEHYFDSVWDECSCVVFSAFFGIAFLRDWNENWPFPVLWLLLSFPNLLAYWLQTFTASSFRIWNSSTGIPSPPLYSKYISMKIQKVTSQMKGQAKTPGERSSGPTRDWPRLAYECPGVSGGGVGWWCPVVGSGALIVVVPAWDLMKEVTIVSLPPP